MKNNKFASLNFLRAYNLTWGEKQYDILILSSRKSLTLQLPKIWQLWQYQPVIWPAYGKSITVLSFGSDWLSVVMLHSDSPELPCNCTSLPLKLVIKVQKSVYEIREDRTMKVTEPRFYVLVKYFLTQTHISSWAKFISVRYT